MRNNYFHPFTLQYINYYFGNHTSYMLKRWIDANYKIISAKAKLYFLRSCKNSSVFPSHLSHLCKITFNVFHYKSRHRVESLFYKFRKEALNIEMFDLHRQIYYLETQLHHNSLMLSNQLPRHIWNGLMEHHEVSFKRQQHRLYLVHKKKFTRLMEEKRSNIIKRTKPIHLHCVADGRGIMQSIGRMRGEGGLDRGETETITHIEPNKFKNEMNDPMERTNKKWFMNLSDTVVPEEVSNLLQMGEKFSLPDCLNKKTAIHEFIKDIESNNKRHNLKNQNMIRNRAIPHFHRYLHNEKPHNSTLKKISSMIATTTEFCKRNPDIMFTRADKGNVTVAMNVDYYKEKMEDLLKDRNTYSIMARNPAAQIERKLNNLLKNWSKKEYITTREYYSLRSSDLLLPKAYGLPKIHKENVPFRIIVSSINTTLYSLASYLQKIISESIPPPNSHVNNSFELYNRLSGKIIMTNVKLFSLDVTSLFTNIPLDLAIEGLTKRWTFIGGATAIPENEFISAVAFVLSSTYFTYDGVIYKQTFGTPMGSPLSPIIADIVMQDLEEKILSAIEFELPLYYRYVDDIVLAAPMEKIDEIKDKFNNYHDRLKFTVELEEDRCLSFLDLQLRVIGNSICIDWYHKKTFSGRVLSFCSNHPINHKIGVIYGLTDRAILLSHPMYHEKNLELCIGILLDNGYPLELIFNEINKRIKKLAIRVTNQIGPDNDTENNVTERKKFIVLPYINTVSESITSIVDKSKFTVGYRCLNRLSRFIKVHKDADELLDHNHIIYKINCKDCNASYVGQTKRKLGTRIKEHRNNARLQPSSHSVVSEHMISLHHTFDWENVRILEKENNYQKRIIGEMIHIKEQINGINSHRDTELLDNAYSDILYELGSVPPPT